MRVLYLFSGRRRQHSVRTELERLAAAAGLQLEFSDRDLLNGDNLLSSKLQGRIIKQVTSGRYHVLLASPPCSTFSRARWANGRGPRPLRSAAHPFGFWRLSPKRRKAARDANRMIAFTVLVLNRQLDQGKALKEGSRPSSRPTGRRQWTQADAEKFSQDTVVGDEVYVGKCSGRVERSRWATPSG